MGDTLEIFFTGKYFRIPNYQRDYTWDVSNVDDLIDDVIESIETETNHYIGTFILSRVGDEKVFNVVDGQQRLTTLIMLINESLLQLGTEREQTIYGDKFVRSDQEWRLLLLNDNSKFFQSLLDGGDPTAETNSQKKLNSAYDRIRTRVAELRANGGVATEFIQSIKNLEIMQFTESDDGKAIRMFQTVNDRGKPLSNVEKAKSLLIYYSNRYLDGELDDSINERFGEIFHFYTDIKTKGQENGVEVISAARFSEDSVMRYHFLAFAEDLYDYSATENYVLDNYLKQTLKPLRTDQAALRAFIEDYVSDLHGFFASFALIANEIPESTKYYKLFSNLGISTWLYPLLVRLNMRGLLDPINDENELLRLLELADLRVYKIRGTNPRADMSFLGRDAKTLDVESIRQKLMQFVLDFMSDAELIRRLSADMYPNSALKHIFIEYSEGLLTDGNGYSIETLRSMNESQPTVEHIFPRGETFDYPGYGFEDEPDFENTVNRLGNLTLLEKSINSKCQNKTPGEKISRGFYGESQFEDPKRLSANLMNEGGAFTKRHVEERQMTLSTFCLERWHL